MSDPIHISLTKLTRFEGRPNGTAWDGSPMIEGYSIRGHYDVAPTPGQPFEVSRYERNGQVAYGRFTTSPVAEVYTTQTGDTTIATENSLYRLTQLPDDPRHAPTPLDR